MLEGLEELVHHCKGCNRTTVQSLIVGLVVNAKLNPEDKINNLDVVYRCRDCGDCNRYTLNDVRELLKSKNSPKSGPFYKK